MGNGLLYQSHAARGSGQVSTGSQCGRICAGSRRFIKRSGYRYTAGCTRKKGIALTAMPVQVGPRESRPSESTSSKSRLKQSTHPLRIGCHRFVKRSVLGTRPGSRLDSSGEIRPACDPGIPHATPSGLLPACPHWRPSDRRKTPEAR